MCVSRVSSPRQREKETEEFSSDLVDTHVHVRLTYTLATLRVRATNKSPPNSNSSLHERGIRWDHATTLKYLSKYDFLI